MTDYDWEQQQEADDDLSEMLSDVLSGGSPKGVDMDMIINVIYKDEELAKELLFDLVCNGEHDETISEIFVKLIEQGGSGDTTIQRKD